MLAFGDSAISLMPPPSGSTAEWLSERIGPFASFARVQAESDALIFELIGERRKEGAERDDILRCCSTHAMTTDRRCPIRTHRLGHTGLRSATAG